MFDRPIETPVSQTEQPLTSADATPSGHAAPAEATRVSLRKYERIAPVYDLLDAVYERSWKGRLREHAFAGLSGRVLDAGAGTGCNIPYYPADADVLAADLSPGMLARAERRAQRLGRPVAFRETDLTATGFADDTFDAAAATYVFCVIPEEVQRAALAEMTRICKPGAEIRILDYTQSKKPLVKAWSRVMTPWLNFAFSARYTAGYERYAQEVGLETIDSRFLIGDVVKLLTLRVPEK
ncbi:Phosphatidylethanolamine N-methyltransferase [Caenispirillum salinarum AK4]|uniref:Phosphatidylethanolamine N-methyltransferase n=1 Tax=Caenispirillum salinarum AK4 TaxID=1238182 RepID=K9H8Z8_9PROT|nr:class I SAM-dependent methyltransferase [Caenispirillum salinarum]EKV27063.1 Phosphatidylethanolamine N-methyltransferase [Caenispirillum salinarum AK4]